MTPAILMLLQFAAPGLLSGGAIGTVLGIFSTPGVGTIVKLGRHVARGDHLSAEDKVFIREYNKTHYRPTYELIR